MVLLAGITILINYNPIHMNYRNFTFFRKLFSSKYSLLLLAGIFLVGFSFAQPYQGVSWPSYNTFTQTFPLNGTLASSYFASAQLNYSGLVKNDDSRTVWGNPNTSATLNTATAPFLSYTVVTNTAITFDRFVYSGLAPTRASKLQVRWSVNNYATSLGEFTPNGSSYTLTSVSLASAGSVASGTITFRVYFYAAGANPTNVYNSDTGPYPSSDGTASTYGPYGANVYLWFTSPPPACSGTPTAGTAAATPSNGSIFVNSSASLALSGYTTGVSGIGIQWQSSATSGGTYTDISGATSATYAPPVATTPGAMYYRAKVTCSTTGLSSYSNIVSITATAMKSPGNALFLDGTNDFVSMPASTKADIDTGTIECWVRRTALNGVNVTLVSKRDANNTRYSFHMGDNLLGIYNGLGWSPLVLASPFVVNKWYHVAFVCKFDSTYIYLNGNYQGKVNGGVGATTGLPLQIGTTNNSAAYGGEFLNGAVDEVRIWSRMLKPEEIKAGMYDTVPANSPNLVAYYKFDQGIAAADNSSVTTVYDASSNAYNGVVTNMALTGTTSNWIQSFAMLIPGTASATNIAGNSFTANWSAPDVGGVTNYFLDVSASPDFTSFVPGYQAKDVGNTTSSPVYGLTYNTPYYYRVRASTTPTVNQAGYSDIVTLTTNATLPVKLVDFKAGQQAAAIVLNWTTAEETNTRYYSVEKSTDGSSFTELSRVNTSGNTQTTRQYTTSDRSPVQGMNYYRLKITDNNGNVEYSGIISIAWNTGANATITLAPQPMHDIMKVKITGSISKGDFKIYSLNGKEVKSFSVNAANGSSEIQITRNNLSSGVYFYKFTSEKGKLLNTGKIIVE